MSLPEKIYRTIFGRPSYAIFVLWLLVIAVFFPILEADYVDFDEQEAILANPSITAPLNLESLIKIFTSFEANQYTPLSMASHWLEYNISGFNSAVSHLISLLLHLLAVTAVFLLSSSLCRSIFSGFVIAAVWGIHTMQVDSVAWVLERRNLLYGAFLFLSLNSWQNFLKTDNYRYRNQAVLFMLLSGISKTLAFMIPFFWLLVDYANAVKPDFKIVREKAAGLVLSAVFVILLFAGAWDGIPKNQPRSLHWQNSAWAISFYVAKTILPTGLTATFEENASTVGIFDSGPLYLGIVLAVFVLLGIKNRIAAVGSIFYMCNIIPVSGLVRVGYSFYVSCHFVYVPFWGLCLLITAVLKKFFEASSLKKYVRAGALVLLLVFAVLSFSHAGIWNNTVSLFEHSIAVDPLGKFARNQLAGAYFKLSEYEQAEKHYRELTRIYPGFYSGYNGLAMIAVRRGDKKRAYEMFNKALQCDPNEALILMNLALLKKSDKDFTGAESYFNDALAVSPESRKIRFLRAELLALQGKYHRAIEDILLALSQNSYDVLMRLNLFTLQMESADYFNAFLGLAEIPADKISETEIRAICNPDIFAFVKRLFPFRNYLQFKVGIAFF